jgi:hypothetical protein
VCGYCQQPGHNIRTCPTHIADEGAARARERRRVTWIYVSHEAHKWHLSDYPF